MFDYPLAIMYLGTLAFVGWLGWLYLQYHDVSKVIKEEILRLRQEVNGLQMAASMKHKMGPPWAGPPQT
jgi:hypothetical protein